MNERDKEMEGKMLWQYKGNITKGRNARGLNTAKGGKTRRIRGYNCVGKIRCEEEVLQEGKKTRGSDTVRGERKERIYNDALKQVED